MNVIMLGPDVKLGQPIKASPDLMKQIGVQSLEAVNASLVAIEHEAEEIQAAGKDGARVIPFGAAAQWRTAAFHNNVATTPGMEPNTRVASEIQRNNMLVKLGVVEAEPLVA